ncbi:hypothetical protein HMSSN036_60440 [Paenibacillus macerans]|nr:hypothetical protein HMSSN036_60440 [Paenibacillus macerans]
MHFPDVEAMAAPGEESLHDVLMSQLNLLTLSKREYRTARYLIGCLDGNGYLEIAPEEAAKALGTDTDSVLRALRLVQSLEPAGVGAADLQECLLLQLEHREQMTPLLKELIERHFEQLCKQRFDAISKRLGVPKRAIVEAYRVLRSLNPRPGGGFESGQKTVYIVPDVLVAAKDGGLRHQAERRRLSRNSDSAFVPEFAGAKISTTVPGSIWRENWSRPDGS